MGSARTVRIAPSSGASHASGGSSTAEHWARHNRYSMCGFDSRPPGLKPTARNRGPFFCKIKKRKKKLRQELRSVVTWATHRRDKTLGGAHEGRARRNEVRVPLRRRGNARPTAFGAPMSAPPVEGGERSSATGMPGAGRAVHPPGRNEADAPVAQWIGRRPPKSHALVRFQPGAPDEQSPCGQVG